VRLRDVHLVRGGSARSPALLGAALASAALGVCLWLPWLRTGGTRRSAYGLLTALRAAGLLSSGARRAFFAALAVAPGLTGAAWVLAFARRRRLSGLATAAVGTITAAAGAAVRHYSVRGAQSGTVWAEVVGVVTLAMGVALTGWRAPPGRKGTRDDRRR